MVTDLNNCGCGEGRILTDKAFIDLTIRRTVEMMVDTFNFAGVKFDGCGPARDLGRWYEVINQTGHPLMIEDCFWGKTVPTGRPNQPPSWDAQSGDSSCTGLDTPSECPYSFYRTSTDVTNVFESVYANVQTLLPFLGNIPLSKPGAWAYADGMQVGRMAYSAHSANEDRTIFGWYVITSSPLILTHNVSDDETNDAVWPVVSNLEAIRINQQWNGHPGRLVKTWAPPAGVPSSYPPGLGVYNVTCDQIGTDASQHGWGLLSLQGTRTNASDVEGWYAITGPGTGRDGTTLCLDSKAGNYSVPMLWVTKCDSNKTGQRWLWSSNHTHPDPRGFKHLAKGNGTEVDVLSVPGFDTSVGVTHPQWVRILHASTLFRFSGGQLQVLDPKNGGVSCLAARDINPVPPDKTLELWSKPLAQAAVAVLVVNLGVPTNATFNLADLGLDAADTNETAHMVRAYTIRDVWGHADAGELALGEEHTVALGAHDSALLVLEPKNG
eukprot:COSAG06_NODE_129_length_22602_cov_7.116318_23_plen_495_part_00